MGYSVDAFNVLLDRFETKYKMIRFSKETNEIAILNFLRHSVMKGGKPVEDCIRKEMALVKNKHLIDYVFSRLYGREGLNETVKKIVDEYINENDIHNDNDNDNERTQGVSCDDSCDDSSSNKEIYVSIISYLNEKANTNYRASSKKTRTCIHARLDEGFTLDDFKTVIDKKTAEWMESEWEKFLRPETLFGTKFESYLNAKIRPSKQGKKEIIPEWMKKEQEEKEVEEMKRMSAYMSKKTAGNNPEVAARAEALRMKFSE